VDCGTTEIVNLSTTNDLTNIISDYSCGGAGYGGAEEAYEIQVPFQCDPEITVELIDVADKGQQHVDIHSMDPAAPACSPDLCDAVSLMDDQGYAELVLPAEAPGDAFLFTVDGRDDFEGRYRLTVSCCGQELEKFCSNQIDDDGDGFLDCVDPDCDNHPACSTPEQICDDGLDNEGDGIIDCADPDCDDSSTCSEQICDDGLDSDGDGFTDCADPDCEGTLSCVTACETFKTLSCGDVITNESTLNGSSDFDGYGCDASGGLCDFGIYGGAELSYLVQPSCNGTVEVEVRHVNGADVYAANLLGHHCDPSAHSCSSTCDSVTHAGEGNTFDGSSAAISFEGQKNKAYWVNVEPDIFFGGSAVAYDIEVQCTCE